MPGPARLRDEDVQAFFRRMQRELPVAVRRSFRNKVVQDAAAGLVKALRPHTPRRSGGLRRSIGRRKYTKWPIQFVGPRLPDGAHGHLIEAGTAQRFTRRGAARGAVKATRWFDSAIQSEGGKIISAIDRKIETRANQVMRRIARRGSR